jgi:hypothetical protein
LFIELRILKSIGKFTSRREPIEKSTSLLNCTSIESIATVVFTEFYTLNSLLKKRTKSSSFSELKRKFKIVGNYY